MFAILLRIDCVGLIWAGFAVGTYVLICFALVWVLVVDLFGLFIVLVLICLGLLLNACGVLLLYCVAPVGFVAC